MKNTFLMLILILASAAIANAQFTPDTPFYSFSGNQTRGGIIYKTAVTDAVWATAICVNPLGLTIGGRLTVRNLYPTVCGALTYTMQADQYSERTDGEYDHIGQNGQAWWIATDPAVFLAAEACHLPGTLAAYNYYPGTPNVFVDKGAGCPALGISNPGHF